MTASPGATLGAMGSDDTLHDAEVDADGNSRAFDWDGLASRRGPGGATPQPGHDDA